MDKSRSRVVRGSVCAALGGVFWGVSGTCGQYLFSHYQVSTLWLTCLRLLSGGVLMLLMALPKHAGELKAIWKHPKDVALVAAYGVCGLMLCQYAYMTGISYSNAATTTVLQTLSIVLIMIIACLQARRRPKWNEALSVLLALFGTYMLATGGNPTEMVLSHQGLFWGLCAAVAVTVYTLVGRPLLANWRCEVVMGLAMLMGGTVMNLGARSWNFRVELPVQGWLLVAVIVLVGTVLSFSLFMQGIRDAGPVRSAILGVTEPVSAAILATVWLGTEFSAADLVGFAAILATIFLLAKSE